MIGWQKRWLKRRRQLDNSDNQDLLDLTATNDGICNLAKPVIISIYLNSLFQAFTEKGSPVTVKIIIKRQVTDIQSEQLTPFLKKLRNLAMNQPGYITGETLKRIDPPGQNLVISTWESIEAWQQWIANPERVPVQANIDVLIGTPTTYEIYSSE